MIRLERRHNFLRRRGKEFLLQFGDSFLQFDQSGFYFHRWRAKVKAKAKEEAAAAKEAINKKAPKIYFQDNFVIFKLSLNNL